MNPNPSLVEYGMYVVGRSLKYIRRGDFQGLIDLIHKRISEKFGVDLLRFESEGKTLKEILEKAAESLGNSLFLVDRLLDSVAIYRYLGMEDEAKKLEEEYHLRRKALCEASAKQHSDHFFYY